MLRFLCDRNRHRAGWRFLRFTTTVTAKKSAEAEKRLDNSPSMPYNNHCCAGVAHLVERDLAKVEVASSSLVARSKKKHHPSGWCFFLVKSGRGSKGHERSEKNMPVACFGARVRVAARQGRQRASSPAPKRKTPVGVSFFLEQHFCSAKVVACGRAIYHARETRLRFPLHTFLSLRYTGVRTDSKTCEQSHNTRRHKEPPDGIR